MRDVTTIREMIEALARLAVEAPDGMNTEVELGICNGTDLQMVDNIDLGHYTDVQDGEAPRAFVMFRAHVHPGEPGGRVLRGAATDVDGELRSLLDDD